MSSTLTLVARAKVWWNSPTVTIWSIVFAVPTIPNSAATVRILPLFTSRLVLVDPLATVPQAEKPVALDREIALLAIVLAIALPPAIAPLAIVVALAVREALRVAEAPTVKSARHVKRVAKFPLLF
jgi:hypothetical protein